jgi:acetylornithine deacetylase
MQEQFCTIKEKDIFLLQSEAIQLLKELIATPSFSKEEDKTAQLIKDYLNKKGIPYKHKLNNVWALNKYFETSKPTILLNSHHDTVRPNQGYTNDPFDPLIKDGKLFGLGSNDAGGCLVSLLATFLFFYDQKELNYNLIYSATAEEEISGNNGVECILQELPVIDLAIVGEPTQMHLAIAEKGLMVLDCRSIGVSGHAAREEGDNAIYKAMSDIEWFRNFQFPKISEQLGPIKMSVTVIKAGAQHNVVPAECEFTVDVRTTDRYTNEEILEIIKQNVSCEIKSRSFRLQPSFISGSHPIVISGKALKRKTFGSPTTSDQALMPFPSLKLGPGDSARSHMADEFIFIDEIKEGIEIYIELLKSIL